MKQIANERSVLRLPGPQRMGISLELGFIPQLLFSRIKSKFDATKVFTTFISRRKNKLGAQLIFPWKISWDEAPTSFMGKIKVGHQLIFRCENKSCKDLHGIEFTFYS